MPKEQKNFFTKVLEGVQDLWGSYTRILANGIKSEAKNMVAKDTKFMGRVNSFGRVVSASIAIPFTATLATLSRPDLRWKGFKGLFSKKEKAYSTSMSASGGSRDHVTGRVSNTGHNVGRSTKVSRNRPKFLNRILGRGPKSLEQAATTKASPNEKKM